MRPFDESDFYVKNIVLACYVGKGSGDRIHHDRPSHGLAFHMSGLRQYTFKTGEILTVHPNDLIYLPRYSDYEVTTLEAGDCYAVNFDIPSDAVYTPFVLKVKNTSGILEYFKNAKAAWESKKEGYLFECTADLYNIICLMTEEQTLHYASKDKRDRILSAVNYIHENYTGETLSIAELAGSCGITPEYFRSIFKSIYGVSPKMYINRLKIARAEELLSSGLYSVTEAARLSGYTDLSHFSREFKKATGKAPQNYEAGR